MKVGIITFHSAHNYGAVLQAYALYRTIKDMGHEPEVIDYRPKFIRSLYSINPLKKLHDFKSLVSLILLYPIRLSKYNRFEDFIKNNIRLTAKRYLSSNELKQIPPIMDAYITGSDQVWNPEINGVMEEYYLTFVKDLSAKKISYAASFGVDQIKNCYEKDISKNLCFMETISVREKVGIDIVKRLVNKETECVLDPVFLLNKQDWHKIMTKPQIKDKYLLVYMMEYNQNLIKLANKIALKKKMKIISISNSINTPKGFYKNIRNAGPSEFLGLIYSADYVITNSFHGTAFSIILEKNFYVVPHTRLNSRIENILTTLNLENRQVLDKKRDIDSLLENSEIDYTMARKILDTKIIASKEYLLKAFK